jgi:hypothetical protein
VTEDCRRGADNSAQEAGRHRARPGNRQRRDGAPGASRPPALAGGAVKPDSRCGQPAQQTGRSNQKNLDRLKVGLIALDRNTATLRERECDRKLGGHDAVMDGGHFHKIHQAQRLKFPLAAALKGTSYERLARQTVLPSLHQVSFAVAERAAGQKLIERIERDCRD